MKLQVLLSAMHLKDYKYINTLKIGSNCIVINQCDKNDIKLINTDDRDIKFISTTERGLSQSRNMAMINASADICIFCDNDVVYLINYEEIIVNEFIKHPKYDIIVFFVKKNKIGSRPYFKKTMRMRYYSALKVFSPEIAFRRESIEKKSIRFKTEFGAGSRYSMGEENIFLYECLKKGLKILYVPKQIACLRNEESTWFKGFNEKYFRDRGAIFYEMSHKLSVILIVQFVLRKYKVYRDEITMDTAIKCMLTGRKHYIKEQKVIRKI